MGSLLFLQINRSKKSIQVFNRHEFMSKIFYFDLPARSRELRGKEYVNFINRIG